MQPKYKRKKAIDIDVLVMKWKLFVTPFKSHYYFSMGIGAGSLNFGLIS
jgi:hypothetical protein